MSRGIPTWDRTLRLLFAGTILFQAAIILTCLVLRYANAAVGFLQYRLPGPLFWIYVWVGVGAPSIALLTLIVLWAKRSSLQIDTSNTSKQPLRQLVVLCVANVCAVAVWFVFGGLVFFAAGGNR